MERRHGTEARNRDAHRWRGAASAGWATRVAVAGVAGAALLAAGLGILSQRARRAELEIEKLPIVAAHDLMGGQRDPASRWMELRIVRAAGGEEVWRQPERMSRLWDPATRFVSVLVPCAPLRRPGSYRLLIHEAGAPEPRFAASFEVVPAGALDP
jgi:hypothetical protein